MKDTEIELLANQILIGRLTNNDSKRRVVIEKSTDGKKVVSIKKGNDTNVAS
ncbi:MAG: hypothetical protein WC319_01640 [Candidatus Paceibacterota bacterium]|jgi:hypothetical protein